MKTKLALLLPFTRVLSISLTVLVFAGCATNPDKIGATYVSPIEYSDLDCDQIRSELIRVNRRLEEIVGKQRKQSKNDAVATGVGVVVFWPALFFLMGDDHKEEIARLKGEYIALETVAIRKSCGFAPELQAAKEERELLESGQK